MFDKLFSDFLNDQIIDGEVRLTKIVKSMIKDRRPKLYDRLSYENKEAFLEPLLFAYLSGNETDYPVDQILFGYIEPEKRPNEVEVLSNSKGIIYLPRIGYFKTEKPNKVLKLRWDKCTKNYQLFDNSQQHTFAFEEIQKITTKNIEVSHFKHPLLNKLFINEQGQAAQFDVSEITAKKLTKLSKALDIIEKCNSTYYKNIVKTTRKIMVFNCETMNSFASISAQGIAFLNAKLSDDEIFFIEDLAHQCGHVIFNTITFETEQYLAVSPNTPLSLFTGNQQETRSVYDAYHGVFTEAVMLQCLDECLENNVFLGKQAHELLGRIIFILRRFGSDLHNLSKEGLFTKKGEWVLLNILNEFRQTYRKYQDVISYTNFSNQPYVFDYQKFKALNKNILNLNIISGATQIK